MRLSTCEPASAVQSGVRRHRFETHTGRSGPFAAQLVATAQLVIDSRGADPVALAWFAETLKTRWRIPVDERLRFADVLGLSFSDAERWAEDLWFPAFAGDPGGRHRERLVDAAARFVETWGHRT